MIKCTKEHLHQKCQIQITKIRIGCQYLCFLYYNKNLSWVAQNFHLGCMQATVVHSCFIAYKTRVQLNILVNIAFVAKNGCSGLTRFWFKPCFKKLSFKLWFHVYEANVDNFFLIQFSIALWTRISTSGQTYLKPNVLTSSVVAY